jgi:hypothetical protein
MFCHSLVFFLLYLLDVYYILYFPHLLGGFLHIYTTYMYYICGLWPPDNVSCIFLTWYQSPVLGHPLHAATRAPIRSKNSRCLLFFGCRPSSDCPVSVAPATFLSVAVGRLTAGCRRRSSLAVCSSSPAAWSSSLVATVRPGSRPPSSRSQLLPQPVFFLGRFRLSWKPVAAAGHYCGLSGRLLGGLTRIDSRCSPAPLDPCFFWFFL